MNIRDHLHRLGLGWRTFLGAAVLAAPDVLNGLTGYNFNTIFPGKGELIGGWVMLARIGMIPVLISWRRMGRADGPGEGSEPQGGPH